MTSVQSHLQQLNGNRTMDLRSNRDYVIWVLVFTLLSGCSSSRKTSQMPPPAPAPKPAEQPVKQPEVVHEKLEKKEFRIGLMLPLNLEQQIQMFDDTSGNAIPDYNNLSNLQFVEGAQLAADSLKQLGINVNLNIAETPADSFALWRLWRQNNFVKCDAVISSVPSSFIPAVTRLSANSKQTLILTQPSNTNFKSTNEHVFMLSPSTYTQCMVAAKEIATRFPDFKYVLLARDVKPDKDIAQIFKDHLPAKHLKQFISSSFIPDSVCKILKSEKAVLIITSSAEAYVNTILNQVNACIEKPALAIGLPTWENFESIDFSVLKNLRIAFFTSTYLDYHAASTKSFRNSFINHYKTEPFISAFQGYEAIMEYVKSNTGHGPLKSGYLPTLNIKYVTDAAHGIKENQGINLIEIKDYTLIPLE